MPNQPEVPTVWSDNQVKESFVRKRKASEAKKEITGHFIRIGFALLGAAGVTATLTSLQRLSEFNFPDGSFIDSNTLTTLAPCNLLLFGALAVLSAGAEISHIRQNRS